MNNQFSHGYALIIGVDEYANTSWNLPVVGKDASAVYATLTHPQKCGYKPENVTLLQGKDATTPNIRRALMQLRKQVEADPQASAVIYYSGHGAVTDDGDYYLVSHEVSSVTNLPYEGVDAENFAKWVRLINVPRLLVVLDCCHAAGMDVKSLPFPVANRNEKSLGKGIDFGQLEAGGGRFVLNSSTAEQKSYIRKDGKMSIFTHQLIDALNGMGSPVGEKKVNVLDLLRYVHKTVQTAATQFDCTQTPVSSSMGEGFPVSLILGGKGVESSNDTASIPEPVSVVTRPASTPPVSTGSLSTFKRDRLIRERANVLEEYIVIEAQYTSTLAEGDRLRLKRKLKQLEQQIEQIDMDLQR